MKDITLKTAQLRQQVMSQKSVPSSVWDAIIVGNGTIRGSRWDKRNIIEQAYQRNAPFYAACNIIAQSIAEMPIEVEYTVEGKRTRTDFHPMLKMMERNSTLQDFIERFVLYYITTGETFAEIVLNRGKPLGLIVLESHKCSKIEGTRANPIKEIKYSGTNEVIIPYENVVHIYKPSLSNYFDELSPAVPLQEVIALHNAGVTWNKNVAQAGGMPPFIAKVMGMDKTQAQELQDDWQAQSGSGNSHRLKVVSQQVELEKMNDNPHDAEWHQAILATMRMIFMTLGISSSLMNDAGNKTYNNVHDARKGLYNESAIPIAKRMYHAISNKLKKYYADNPEIHVKTEAISAIQEDRKALVDRLVSAVDAGLMTANEARKELGYSKSKGATADVLQNSRIINNIPKVETDDNPEEPAEEQNPVEDEI